VDLEKYEVLLLVFTEVFVPNRIEQFIGNRNIAIEILNSPKYKLNPFYYYKVFKCIKKYKADIVLNCNPQLSAIIRIVCKVLTIKNITVYQNRISSSKYLIKKLEEFTRKLSNHHIAVSTAVYNELKNINIENKSVVFNTSDKYDGIIDVNKYRNMFNIDPNASIYLNIARYHPQKNQKNLILGFEKFLKSSPNSYLFLAGWGPLYEELQQLISSKALGKNIIITGPLDDLQNLFAFADFYIMPSYFEGLALASTEALGFGLPLIISNIPEFEDIKRENFILIKGFGPNEIYEALYESSILENRSIEKMRSNSIDKFNNDFDSKKMTQNYENIIDYTLKND